MNQHRNGKNGSNWITGRNILLFILAVFATFILINVIEALTGWDIGGRWSWER